MGIITFAFGIGGAIASFAAPAAHDRATRSPKSAIFFAVRAATQKTGTQG
jgi:hydrogenase-4 component F